MVPNNSLDDSYTIIAALIHDVPNVTGLVFSTRSLNLTCKKVRKRLMAEGMGFLTKTLPRLGKALDRVLTGNSKLNAIQLGFAPAENCEYPKLFGELFSMVLRPDGGLLPSPSVSCVSVLRQLLFVYYKYKLPYTDEQEQTILAKFEETEQELLARKSLFEELEKELNDCNSNCHSCNYTTCTGAIARRAKDLLTKVFLHFDPTDIIPGHGPGAVATKQRLWSKYLWTNVSRTITNKYPFDAYFQASLGHVCDTYNAYKDINEESLPARVCLVPKDSRGPRLISAEPVDYQWVQQGLGRAIVSHVERHWTTRFNVFFTDQHPNQLGALLGSRSGKYATLDLNEASDRVSLGLVRLLFPPHIYEYLEACRSLSTVLPNGKELTLEKFAPMGSSLCFPILALTIWAILTAGSPDADTRESILVYGDDVIVPTAHAANAIEQLESFGLKVNRDKSCTTGLFRESCGTDAFQGVDVTPVRLRTVWSSARSPDSYTSWIAYANSFYDRKYTRVYDLIVERLHRLYGAIPGDDMFLTCPSLRFVPIDERPKRRRYNRNLQRLEYNVWDVRSPSINKRIDGWSMLLRYFSESGSAKRTFEWRNLSFEEQTRRENMRRSGLYADGSHHLAEIDSFQNLKQFRVGSYTSRRSSMLVRRWR